MTRKCLGDTSRKATYKNVQIYYKKYFNRINGFIKFSKHNFVELYFNE